MSVLRLIASSLAGAPPRTRWLIGAQLLFIAAATAFVILDAKTLADPVLWALATANSGLLLWILAAALHRIGQHEDLLSCGPVRTHLDTRVLHRLLPVVPILAIGAAMLIALAIGMLLPFIAAKPPLAFLPLMLGYLLLYILRTVSRTNRFLYEHAREQAEAAARARGEATEAQLHALQAQVNPHFLFNALNTVAALIASAPQAAETTVENLAQVLRRTLDRSQSPLTTVEEEIDYLRAYLSVERERFGDRLDVQFEIDDDTLAAEIPPMTLQPLVENSLKHGIGARLEGGTLVVRSVVEDGRLRLTVTDDGGGFPPRPTEGTGIGNLRRRLATLYGDDAQLALEPGDDGATVVVTIPMSPLATTVG